MKKRIKKKLELNRETLRRLDVNEELKLAAGGRTETTPSICLMLKDPSAACDTDTTHPCD